MLFGGAFDALRFVAAGIVGDSFDGMPLVWGYAIFDTIMGLPMAGGAVLGGIFFRAAPSLPSVVVTAVAASLLGLLAANRRRQTREPAFASE